MHYLGFLSFSISSVLSFIFEIKLAFDFLPNIFNNYLTHIKSPAATNINSDYFDIIAQYSITNSFHSSYIALLLLFFIFKQGIDKKKLAAVIAITILSLTPKAYFSMELVRNSNSSFYLIPIFSFVFAIISIILFSALLFTIVRKNL